MIGVVEFENSFFSGAKLEIFEFRERTGWCRSRMVPILLESFRGIVFYVVGTCLGSPGHFARGFASFTAAKLFVIVPVFYSIEGINIRFFRDEIIAWGVDVGPLMAFWLAFCGLGGWGFLGIFPLFSVAAVAAPPLAAMVA